MYDKIHYKLKKKIKKKKESWVLKNWRIFFFQENPILLLFIYFSIYFYYLEANYFTIL